MPKEGASLKIRDVTCFVWPIKKMKSRDASLKIRDATLESTLSVRIWIESMPSLNLGTPVPKFRDASLYSDLYSQTRK